MLTTAHIASMIMTLGATALIGIISMKKVKSASDFSVGKKSVSAALITGTIVGTLVGGASTIGTAQLAFKFGLSAWWFTLGAGISCILMGLFMARPLQRSDAATAPELLSLHHGNSAGLLASIFSSVGIFINIIGQVLAAVALLVSMFSIDSFSAAAIAVAFIIVYVIFGGVWGTGMVGIFKIFILYATMITIGIMACKMAGGYSGLGQKFPAFPWFSFFGRGVTTDTAAAFSMLVGVFSTQTYIQAMFSGKNPKTSRRGAIVSGLIIPPIGLAGVLVGLYMRSTFPEMNSGVVMPSFILQFLPPWIGGVFLAGLFISVIGTGAGLVLGVSTMMTQDIFKKLIKKDADDRAMLIFMRLSVAAISGITLLFVAGNINSLILKWSFLSMGIRGSVIFFPLLTTLFLNRFISSKAILYALAMGPISTILWGILMPVKMDPLYIGMGTSLATIVLFSMLKPKGPQLQHQGEMK